MKWQVEKEIPLVRFLPPSTVFFPRNKYYAGAIFIFPDLSF